MLAQKNVILMSAGNVSEKAKENDRPRRVAAYCRVSTDFEEQQTSFKAQKEHYTDKINRQHGWSMAGIYADDGISGTAMKNRKEFMRMMRDCEKGKIDTVLCKSISRFSRNTVDCLNSIRALRSLGIPVIFEKENIDTMKVTSEMIITLMGSFAQAESESMSKNIKIGKRYGYKNGNVTFQYNRILGYEKGEDGNPKINPEQAEIVKRIYREYLDGCSISTIKKKLESEGIPSATGKPEWSISAIRYMLQNEKYIGDAVLQKTYVADFLTKKTVKNNGAIPKYYVENNHEGIIDRDIFHRVQEEIARRSGKRKVAEKTVITENGKYSSKYALTELLSCGNCGTQYRRVTWSKRGNKKAVWRCISRLEYGTKYCTDSPTIEESALQAAIVKAINKLADNKELVINVVKEGLLTALGAKTEEIDAVAIKNKIAQINKEMMELMTSGVQNQNMGELDGQFKEMSKKIQILQATLTAYEQSQRIAGNENSRISELFAILEKEDFCLTEYNDKTVRMLIARVKVISQDKVMIRFKCGFELEEMLTEN